MSGEIGEITCRELIEFLGDYVEGALPPDEVLRFEAHLRLCPACVDYLHGYRETIRLVLRAGQEEEEEELDVPEQLIAAIVDVRAARAR